jgi:hypothetical protein
MQRAIFAWEARSFEAQKQHFKARTLNVSEVQGQQRKTGSFNSTDIAKNMTGRRCTRRQKRQVTESIHTELI